MNRLAPEARAFAVALSALAGFVDAVGYLSTGGFFLSFMSGNSTRLAVGIATHGHDAAIAALLILAFVAGVVLGALVGARWPGPRRGSAILTALAVLLALAALCVSGGLPLPGAMLAAAAMGCENAVFARDGEVRLGLTYMTGTLVRCGQGLAEALRGGARWGWLPPLLLWLGLAAGAVAGSLVYVAAGKAALWLAAGVAGIAAFAARRVELD